MAQHDDKQAEAVAKRAQRFATLDNEEINAEFMHILGRRGGRRLLWWLLGIGRIGTQPFRSDPYEHAFNSGELNIGLQVQARIIEADPQGFINMQVENAIEHRERAAVINGVADAGASGGGGSAGGYDNDDHDD